MVEKETGSRFPIWQTFGRIQWYVIPESRVTLHGAATWRIQCHDPRATLKIVLHRILFFFCFPNAVWASASGGFRNVSDRPTLVKPPLATARAA